MLTKLRSLKFILMCALFSTLLASCASNSSKTETEEESYIRWYQEIGQVTSPTWKSSIYEKLQLHENSATPTKLIGKRIKIEINVDPSGKVLNYQILKPSKSRALNEATKEALNNLTSLPPPPPNLVKSGQASCLWELQIE